MRSTETIKKQTTLCKTFSPGFHVKAPDQPFNYFFVYFWPDLYIPIYFPNDELHS